MQEKLLYTPAEAVTYLAEVHNRHITVPALRWLRLTGRAHTERKLSRLSLWTREELDAIQPRQKPGRKSRSA